jgi:hypothetical protein
MSSTVGNYTGFLSGKANSGQAAGANPNTLLPASGNNTMWTILHGDTLITMGDGTKKKLRLCQTGDEVKTLAPWSAWIGKLINADGSWNARAYSSLWMPGTVWVPNPQKFDPWSPDSQDYVLYPMFSGAQMTVGKAAIFDFTNFGTAESAKAASFSNQYNQGFGLSAGASIFDSVNPQIAAPTNVRLSYIGGFNGTIIGIRYFKYKSEIVGNPYYGGGTVPQGTYMFFWTGDSATYSLDNYPYRDFLFTPLNNAPPVETCTCKSTEINIGL